MPIYTPSGFLDITNATLRTSNIESQNINFTGSGGSISVGPAFDFQQVSAIGNTTPETIQFTNATTSFVTSGNVEVGKNISVVDATVSSNMSVGGNVTVSSNLSVSGNVTIGKNIFLTSNTTTSINSNVIVEHSGPHSREPTTPLLKKFPEIDFDASKMDGNDTANTYVQAGYVVTASSQSSGSEVWRLFDDGDWNQEAIDKYPATTFTYNPSSNPYSLGDVSGEWFKVKFPRKVIINKFTLNVGDSINNGLAAFKVLGSDDDTNWTEVKDVSGLTSASYTTAAPFVTTVESVSSEAYRYYAVVITQLLGVARVSIHEVEFYGYEEDLPAGDTSLDTTFTSILNRPQTSGVKVYVDGDTLDNKVTGPTPTSTGATYDSTGKYWSITSNVTLEANTFLEGDAPHSVSVWFNSSNLEANVSNTCVFSVSDQEKLDSQNLDLQSNTWHNLTYSYQGEGGSRVTYLDGRKVSEDQAEDTFGEYPPFAMTGYSQGGYVVSASSESSASWQAWEAFDKQDTENSAWLSSGGYPNTSGNATSGRNLGTSSGGSATADGDWLKIELPHKIRLNYITMTGYNNVGVDDFDVVATNDDTNWEVLLSDTLPSAAYNVPYSFVIPSSVYYKYYAIIVKSHRGTVHPYTGIYELKFYGHRENDLVRLPDPTRVLKYPHIAMTGPAQRGYVANVSSILSSSYNAYSPFNGNTGVGNRLWISESGGDHTYTSGSGNGQYTGTVRTVSVPVSGTGTENLDGEYVELELPHKIKLTDVGFQREYYQPNDIFGPSRIPAEGSISASNDGVTWYTIHSWTGLVPGDVSHTDDGYVQTLNGGTNFGTINTSSPNYGAYKYYRFIWERLYRVGLSGADNPGIAGCDEIEFYGTEEATPVPIQIGGGNIDRVANFRVYDKFVGEDQALEIWDAQKDTFRGVKNSMTLHKGYLGIGTGEPEGRLAILDEPHNLEEFPPRAMSDYKTYFEGHGVFKVSASSEQNTTTTLGWHVFAKIRDDINKRWRSDSNLYDNTVSPATTTSANATFDGIGVRGEWILLEMPYNICLKKYEFIGFTSQTPHTGQIWGSDDSGTTWHHVDTFQNAVGSVGYPTPTNTFHVLGNTKYYSKYVFIVEKLTSADDAASMSSLKYFGTREQRQSVLHDGQLTLTKNLDVPRIGPPLDADDTPRRDRLVVEYNTSSNPTFEGAVRDTSGRGNDGVFYGGASYSAVDKALVFDGTDDYTRSGILTNMSGDKAVSYSVWIKADTLVGTMIVALGQSGVYTTSQTGGIYMQSNGTLYNTVFGNGIQVSGAITLGNWIHIVATKIPGGSGIDTQTLYVNGVKPNQSNWGTPGTSLSLDDPVITLGASPTLSQYFNGSISNFKLYDCALTAEEVKTLYDMGRNGKIIPKILQIDTPVQINAPLYAPGTIVNVSQFVDTDDYSQASDNTNFTTTLTTPEISMKAGSKVHLHVCIPWRHDYEAGWSGGYHLIYFRLNKTVSGVAASTWVMLSNSGYHMDYGSSVISEYTNSYYLPLSVDEDFTIQFEHRYRPYMNTASAFRINQSHHLNGYVDANLLKLGFQANNMGYLKFIVTEISK